MSKPLQILHLEDNPDYSELVKAMLEKEGQPVEMVLVDKLADFLIALEQRSFDVILGDYKLPDCNGLQALQSARQRRPETPFLLVSGTIGEQAAIESLKSGATDYVLKHWPERLVPAVRRAVQEAQERAQRKKMETELLRREKYFRALTENSLDILTILNRDGLFQYNSPSVKQVLGYAPEELAGQNAFALIHPDDLPNAMQAFEQALKDPELRVTQELRFRRQDGSWCHLEIVGRNRLTDPEIAGLVLNTRDITARKRTEEALRQSEFSLRESQRVARIGSYVMDIPAGCWTGSIILDEIFGIDHNYERTVAGWSALLHPDERDKMLAYFSTEVLAQRKRFDKEYRIIRRNDGQERWVAGLGELTLDADGRPVRMTGVIQDITERRRAEEILRQNEGYFRALTENAMDVITVLNPDGTIRYESPSVERVLGYTPEELASQNAFELVHPEDKTRIQEVFRVGIAKPGAVVKDELRFRHKDGSWRILEIIGRNLFHDPGVKGVVINSRDITERQQLEAQFRQAQKMEAMGQLAGGVAHDLNNLLTVIRGNTDLVLMHAGQLSAEMAECLRQVIIASDRAANLTRQLLAFGRKQVLRAQPLNLNDVIANLVKMLTRVIGEDIRLQCNYTERLPLVQADPGMMEQVLMNLVVNARDAMRSGGQMIIATQEAVADPARVPAHVKARTGKFVCLSVSDTGSGIAPEHLPRIFEPFFTTKEVGKGTGLGLATVHGIVQQHGGWIDVESELGKGTSFRIYLPASSAPAGQLEAAAPEKAVRGGTETILVVEDEAAVRELSCKFLAGLGYKILQAESGVAALEVWRQHQGGIDLLFTDLVMPDRLNGWQLAEVLLAEQPGLKVLFSSGYGMEVAGKEFVLQLGKNFLPKPYTPHKLATAVRDCLDSASRGKG